MRKMKAEKQEDLRVTWTISLFERNTSTNIGNKYFLVSNLIKIRSVVLELLHTDRQTG
jgi:hypothetical protein